MKLSPPRKNPGNLSLGIRDKSFKSLWSERTGFVFFLFGARKPSTVDSATENPVYRHLRTA